MGATCPSRGFALWGQSGRALLGLPPPFHFEWEVLHAPHLGTLGQVSPVRGFLGGRAWPGAQPEAHSLLGRSAGVCSPPVVSVIDTQAARQSYGVWLGGYFV